jgi:putative MATE family efflux protein
MSRLFWPVLIEQSLSILIGMVGTMLVSSVGASAVSGVNLVDQLNNVFIAVFNAIATGATVVVAHKIGAGLRNDAGKTAVQSLVAVTGSASVLGLATLLGGRLFLRALYGSADAEVLSAGNIYIFFSAISYPFVGLYSASAGIMRASGNSRTPLIGTVIANIVNITLASLLIFTAKAGVYGVAIAMLCARATSGIFSFVMLKRGAGGFELPKITLRIEKEVMKPVLDVGIPSGVDSLILQGVRVVLASFMSGMGTPALQANSIASSMNSIVYVSGMTFQIISTTIIGQAYGARKYKEVMRSALQLCGMSAVFQAITAILVLIFFKPLASLYSPSAEALSITWEVIVYNTFAQPLFWTTGFVLAQILRTVGDARYTMIISIFALICFRLTGAWFFGIRLGWGVNGIWISMYADWVIRTVFFIPRFLKKRWADQAEQTCLDEI